MNKPATPLPWANIGTRISARADSIGSTEQALDAVYIVHAANAYPRLVDALKALVKAEEEYGDQDNVAVNEAWSPAHNLLRELGEL